MRLLRENILNLLVFGVMVAISYHYLPLMPPMMATKFDLSGNPIQYSSKTFVAYFMPSVYLFVIFFIGALIEASPKKFSMPNSRRAVTTTVFGVGLLFACIHLAMFLGPENMPRYLMIGFGLFMLVSGNVLSKTERNFMIGIRVPWTLASERNWKATHRFAAKTMVVGGLITLLLAFVYPNMVIGLIGIMLPSIVPVGYSYIYFQRHERFSSPAA